MAASQERLILLALLLAAFAIRSWNPFQPIVENYVGRQVPTAMVAGALARTGDFFHPQLQTGPWPNYFVVEPPIYAGIVAGLSRLSGQPIEPIGRLVSSSGIALACWGLFILAGRREGSTVALIAVASLALFPVTVRYGRAFQPDALMLGFLMAGLACWDEADHGGGRAWRIAAWFALAVGLSLKVISAYLLLPLLVPLLQRRQIRGSLVLLSTLLPALAWYAWAFWLVSNQVGGSRAQVDSAGIWATSFWPMALSSVGRWQTLARYVAVRAFSPIGFVFGVMGWFIGRRMASFWKIWAAGLTLTFLILAGKVHHEYYWMAAGPLLAIGLGRNLMAFARNDSKIWTSAVATLFLVVCPLLAVSTFQTPPEWRGLPQLVDILHRDVPVGEPIVAVEALIQASGRPGYRLEFAPDAQRRAAGEWGPVPDRFRFDDPSDLVRFYQSQGARFVVGLESSEPRRASLRDHLKADPSVSFREWPGAGWIATLH